MSRVDKLKELEDKLYAEMQMAGSREIASIAKQYREVLKEIEEIEGNNGEEDEISRLLAE